MSKELSTGIPEADYFEVPEEVNVYSWSTDPPGTKDAKSTQVHVHFGAPPGPVFLVRFKGPGTLGRLIDALIVHHLDVWGRPRPPREEP